MWRQTFLAVVLGIASLGWLGAEDQAARAQDPIENSIGVIDMQRILRESIAVTRLSERVESMRRSYREELEKGEKVIRDADVSLARERGNLESDVYVKRRRELELKASTLQRDFQERMRNLDKVFRQSMAQIQQLLTLIAQEIAGERDLDLVLAKATVVLVKPNLEFTDEALLRLNSRLPEVVMPEVSN